MIVASEIKDTLDYSLPKTKKKIIATYIPILCMNLPKKKERTPLCFLPLIKMYMYVWKRKLNQD